MNDRLNFKQLESKALAAWKPVKEGFDDLKPKAKEFGKALIALRAGCTKRGQFMAWLRDNRIDENRAMYCLRLAQEKVKTASASKSDPESFTITKEDFHDDAFESLKRRAKAENLKVKNAACDLIERALKELPDVKKKLEDAA